MEFDPQKMAKNIHDALLKAMKEVANDVSNEQKTKCPIDTGALRSTIHHEVKDNGSDITVTFKAGGGAVNYAIYVEYGNSNPNYPQQPFFRYPILRLQSELQAKVMSKLRGY